MPVASRKPDPPWRIEGLTVPDEERLIVGLSRRTLVSPGPAGLMFDPDDALHGHVPEVFIVDQGGHMFDEILDDDPRIIWKAIPPACLTIS